MYTQEFKAYVYPTMIMIPGPLGTVTIKVDKETGEATKEDIDTALEKIRAAIIQQAILMWGAIDSV